MSKSISKGTEESNLKLVSPRKNITYVNPIPNQDKKEENEEYTILEELGKGSFATVFKGLNKNTKEIVAIKSVNRDKLNKKLLENLDTEIKLLSKLHSHPNIVSLSHIIKQNRTIHLVMEYCSWGDLGNFIRSKGFLNDSSYYEKHEILMGRYKIVLDSQEYFCQFLTNTLGGLSEVIVRWILRQICKIVFFLIEIFLI